MLFHVHGIVKNTHNSNHTRFQTVEQQMAGIVNGLASHTRSFPAVP